MTVAFILTVFQRWDSITLCQVPNLLEDQLVPHSETIMNDESCIVYSLTMNYVVTPSSRGY